MRKGAEEKRMETGRKREGEKYEEEDQGRNNFKKKGGIVYENTNKKGKPQNIKTEVTKTTGGQ